MGVVIAISILVGLVATPLLAIRLTRRLGRPIVSAGPTENHFPPPDGQEQVPWELHSIVAQLPKSPTGQVSNQMVYTVNRLLDAAGIADKGHLPANATVQQLQLAVTVLENHLGLTPLYDGVHLPSALQQGTVKP